MMLLLLLASVGAADGFVHRFLPSFHRSTVNHVGMMSLVYNSGKDMMGMPFRLHSSGGGDDFESFGEDLTYLNEEFMRLAKGRTEISFDDFLGSEAIQAILSDEEGDEDYLTDIREIWTSQAKSLDAKIDLSLFVSINREVDDLFEYVDEDEEIDEEGEAGVKRLSDIIEGRNNNSEDEFEDGEIIEVRDIDIWDPQFNVKEYFGLDFLKYLKKFYDESVDEKNGLLSFSNFCEWQDIKLMLKDGELDETCLTELWAEAIMERNKRQPINENENENTQKPYKGFKAESSYLKNGYIDFEMFTRMNVRLDVVLDEIQEALGNLSENEVDKYYEEEFLRISEGEELIGYNQLLAWSDVQKLLEGQAITMELFNGMWEALPKRPLGTFYKNEKSKKVIQSDGIGLDAFLFFNTALDDIDSDVSTGALE